MESLILALCQHIMVRSMGVEILTNWNEIRVLETCLVKHTSRLHSNINIYGEIKNGASNWA